MNEITLPPALSQELSAVYREMESQYDSIAGNLGLSCNGCPDNCCDSYFLHYTYSEWAYLWEGLRALEPDALERTRERAGNYVAACRQDLARGRRPRIMCPLNEGGLCIIYTHRLMICRLHGVPSSMTRPDGRTLRFPGCYRCQEIVRSSSMPGEEVPFMERTALLKRIVAVESELLGGRRHLYPKVRRTIAEMIADGPPRVDKPFCQR